MSFDYTLDYKNLNLRRRQRLYRVGKGEQGVLLVEPYKSEILPHWRFKTVPIARKSVRELLQMFERYRSDQDFVGMDMTRKFLQMGYTRARRYANHKNGRKYIGPVPDGKKGKSGAHGREVAPFDHDEQKARVAQIFYKAWKKVEATPDYRAKKQSWKRDFG